jgi:hypothetical protein
MKHNVGSYDAGVRFVAGCSAMFVGVQTESWWGLVGLVPLITAAIAFCPLYGVFRFNTTAVNEFDDERWPPSAPTNS